MSGNGKRRKVFIPNRSFHGFDGAKEFGELIFLTEGSVNRFGVNSIFRKCSDTMADCGPDDYILISSLSIINAVAASIMAFRFGRINFLLFDNFGKYVVRSVYLTQDKESRKTEKDDSRHGSSPDD